MICWSRLLRLLESARRVRGLLVLRVGNVILVPIAAVVAPQIVSWVLCAQILSATVRSHARLPSRPEVRMLGFRKQGVQNAKCVSEGHFTSAH